jgi:hypothetical protein
MNKQPVMEFQTRFIRHEDRRIARQSLTGKHGFRTIVLLTDEQISASLSDFSSLGFAITLDKVHAEKFSVGDVIKLKVSPLLNHHYEVQGIIIDNQAWRKGLIKISAVIEHQNTHPHDDLQEITFTPEQSLKGVIAHPFLYKQSTNFEIESLSRKGFFATRINSDFTLFESMEVTFSIATEHGLQDVRGRISNLSLTSENDVRCFIEPIALSNFAGEELAQHCFHFAQKTPLEIGKAGLTLKHIQPFVQYRFVETQAEYEAVLKLRRKSYARLGLCAKDEAIARFALEQDAYGRILIVFHNARVIGSALLVFGEKGTKPFEFDTLLPTQAYSRLPRYIEIMEITEICIEGHYQDTDVINGVFESMYREGLSAGKKYILTGSSPELMNRYRHLGFKSLNISYSHPRNQSLVMQLMVLNEDTGMTGKGMSPVRWWEVWGYVSMYLYQRRIIEYKSTQKMRVSLNRFLYQLMRGFKRFIQR